MSASINTLFSKVSEANFYELANTFVKFAVAHELVHVQQAKNGMSFDEYFSTQYSDSQFEIQANTVAMSMLKEFFRVDDRIIEIFKNKSKLIS